MEITPELLTRQYQANASICFYPDKVASHGSFNGDNPLTYSLPLVLVQLATVILLSRALAFLLRPLRQPLVLWEMIVGISLGPTVFRPCGQKWEVCERMWETFAPRHGDMIIGIFSYIGIYYFMFVEGLKLDFSMIPKAGKNAMYIATTGFTVYILAVIVVAQFFKDNISENLERNKVVFLVALSFALSIFPTLQPILTELRLLNTDTGRQSMKVATLYLIPAILIALGAQVLKHSYRGTWYGLAHFGTILAIWAILLLVFRPVATYMVRSIPEGRPAKPAYIFIILLSVMVVACISNAIAATAFELVFILAMLVPSGPPLGSALIEKSETFSRVVFLPLFFVMNGLLIDFTEIDNWAKFGIWQLILLSAWVTKLVATIFVCLYLQMPSEESVAVALAGNLKGLVEPIVFYTWYRYDVIDKKMMSTLNFTVILMIALSSPVMAILTQRVAKSRRWGQVTSIEHSKPDGELRMMACVYTQDNAPSLLNLLDVSYPNKQSPICIYLLHLMELVGRAAPTLGPHKFQQRSSAFQVKFDKIVSIFRNHEKQSDGCVTVQPFVSVSPINTMHLDVCALAAEKRVSIVVVPFYEILAMDGTRAQFRNVAQNIMAEALCSVGLLIDRGRPNYASIGWDSSNIYTYHVGIIFLGGQDDREALAYMLRMACHPGTDVTVLRCLGAYDDAAHVGERERLIDERAVGDFRLKTLDNKNVTYKEEVVKNGEDIVVAIRSMRSHFDLVVVGRRHQAHSKIMDELLPWSDYEELGVVGDILAAPDFAKFALTILVVQQSMAASHSAAKQKAMAVKEHTSETPLTPDINEAEPEPEHSHFSQSHPVIVVEAR